MSQIVSATLVVAFAVVFRGAVKQRPVLFYVLAALVAAVGMYFTFNPSPGGMVRALAYAIQKGHPGFSMLALVMFVGVFDRKSVVRRALGPVRGELSIIGAILMLAHAVPYLANYLAMAGAVFSLKPSVQMSLALAVVLLFLLGVLAVTSIKALSVRMEAHPAARLPLLPARFRTPAWVYAGSPEGGGHRSACRIRVLRSDLCSISGTENETLHT